MLQFFSISYYMCSCRGLISPRGSIKTHFYLDPLRKMPLTSGETDLILVDSPVSFSFIYHIINAILCIIIGGK